MSGRPKHKQPAFAHVVNNLKKPVTEANPDAFWTEHPTWRVGRLEMVDPYGFHALSSQDAESIRERLAAFERLTWREIVRPITGGHPQNHLMPIDRLKCEKAKARLEDIAPDVDDLMSLRVSAKGRLWGIMDRATCQLVFWDPLHQIYPVEK